jgi:hypothetical protein
MLRTNGDLELLDFDPVTGLLNSDPVPRRGDLRARLSLKACCRRE